MGQTERYNTNRHHLRPIKKIQAGDKMDALVFGDSGSMGSSLNGNGFIREQHERNKGFIYSIGRNIYRVIVKRTTAMAEFKIMSLADILGIPIFTYAAWLNLGDIKGFVLFLIAVLYGIARLWFYIKKQNDEDKMRKLKIKEREHEVQEILNDDES